MSPPSVSRARTAVVVSLGLNMCPDVLKRLFVQSSLCLRHIYTEVDDPRVTWPLGYVLSYHPALDYVGVRPPVRVAWRVQHGSRLTCVDVEGTRLHNA